MDNKSVVRDNLGCTRMTGTGVKGTGMEEGVGVADGTDVNDVYKPVIGQKGHMNPWMR